MRVHTFQDSKLCVRGASLLLLCLLHSPVGADDPNAATKEKQTVTVPLPLAAISVGRGADDQASFSGARLGGRTGQPALPQISLKVLLPPDVVPSSVSAVIVEAKTKTLDGQWQVRPAPPIAALGGKVVWPEDAEIVNDRDVAVYQRNAYHPADFVQQVINIRLRHWRFAEVRVFPYLFNPVSGSLKQLAEGQLAVSFARSGRPRPATSDSPVARHVRQRVARQVANFDSMVREYESSSSGQEGEEK